MVAKHQTQVLGPSCLTVLFLLASFVWAGFDLFILFIFSLYHEVAAFMEVTDFLEAMCRAWNSCWGGCHTCLSALRRGQPTLRGEHGRVDGLSGFAFGRKQVGNKVSPQQLNN